MKKSWIRVLLSVLLLAACALPAWPQLTGTVKGVCIDRDGSIMAGATVELVNLDSGQKYQLKTDKKGEYFSLGIQPGTYRFNLLKDGQMVFFLNNVHVGLSADNKVDFKLNEKVQGATPIGPTPEQKAQQEALAKENIKIKGLNDMLASARVAHDAGNMDQAISTMQQATAADPNRDLLWAVLGSYQLEAAKKAPDVASRTALYSGAADSYQKALQLCTAGGKVCTGVGGYHNNLGQAYANTGKVQEAISEYNTAAQADPAAAAQYYFNLGAVLTNTGKYDEANVAFDKAIVADPTKADAYYQKGVNLLGKGSVDTKTGKVIYPPEAGQSIQKYLELQPSGAHAEEAKQILASMGESVQTSYGSKAPPKKK